jgi:D-threo-aldose 1-dehydrogenase
MSEPTRDLPARLINRRGFAVSVLGFGGASIGNLYRPTGDDEATAAVDEAWAGGIRYYDTAPHYGLGLSERRLGEALRGKPRDEYVLSTKVGRLLVPNPAPTGSDLEAGGFAVHDDLLRQFDYSRDGVLRSLEGSLDRLGVERIDIVYVHDPENHMDDAIAHAFPALCDLRDQGVVKAIGAGMNHVAPLRRIVAEADVDVLMVAGRWTLLDRSAAPLLEECAARDVAVVDAISTTRRHRPKPSHARSSSRSCAPTPASNCRLPRCSSRSAIRSWSAWYRACATRPRSVSRWPA